ncbi:PAS domain-containing protein [Vibrio tubiashii]|uniref:helix-turn-helix transcriptional regulator n=1 Tax=Vibrio tubiashii TaxID=29498 RepID=UPI00234F05F2|nr:PAS domain-containing protein [Vibrio tubiashii]WCP66810.1 PAS domain-containing protein [Vibrio tubiashii]
MLVNLSDSDKAIIRSTYNIVDGIAVMYGEHTEVALHSLDIDNPSIVKIANGHVTGRSVGAPITNLAIEKLKDGKQVTKPYFTRSICGKMIRSVTTIISNDKGTPIAMLCINTDMDAPMHAVISAMLPAGVSFDAITESPEVFSPSANDMLATSIAKFTSQVDSMGLTKAKRTKEIVRKMYSEGLFNVKDAVSIAAQEIGISPDTVYRYLRQFKKEA